MLFCSLRRRTLPDYKLLPISSLLSTHDISLQFKGKWDLVTEDLLGQEVVRKVLENYLETSQYDLLVHVSHPSPLHTHKLEYVQEEEQFEVLSVHRMPPRHSFLYGVDKFMRKSDNLRSLGFSIAGLIFFSKQLGFFLLIELQEIKTHLVVDLQLKVNCPLVQTRSSLVYHVVLQMFMPYLSTLEELTQQIFIQLQLTVHFISSMGKIAVVVGVEDSAYFVLFVEGQEFLWTIIQKPSSEISVEFVHTFGIRPPVIFQRLLQQHQ